MADMTRPAATALAPDFDDFLFAPIGEDKNGMMLSVISALARLDVDPWEEAAKLAQLPETTAARRLASLIAALPGRPVTNLDPGTIVPRLIALLPYRVRFNARSTEAASDVRARAVLQSQSFRAAALILMVLVLGGIEFAATQRLASRAGNPEASTSSTAIPPTPPSASGQ
jgi:hypothetical protein